MAFKITFLSHVWTKDKVITLKKTISIKYNETILLESINLYFFFTISLLLLNNFSL